MLREYRHERDRRPAPERRGEPGELSDPRRLRAALDAGQLRPYFQPIVHLDTAALSGLEALLRWEHPRRGLLLPAQFLPAVEASGLIGPVGRRVLAEALRLLAELRDHPAGRALTMAVNLSASQLARPGLATTVIEQLRAYAVPPAMLSLELTEAAALPGDRIAGRELRALRAAGVSLGIDDYGTGYSSLMRVLDLPISTLKLDRRLVQRLPGDRRALAVARSTLELAGDRGIAVVATGIELAEQQNALLELGCRYGQGFRYGWAVGPRTTAARLRRDAPVAEPAG